MPPCYSPPIKTVKISHNGRYTAQAHFSPIFFLHSKQMRPHSKKGIDIARPSRSPPTKMPTTVNTIKQSPPKTKSTIPKICVFVRRRDGCCGSFGGVGMEESALPETISSSVMPNMWAILTSLSNSGTAKHSVLEGYLLISVAASYEIQIYGSPEKIPK